jgi:two-component system sensor histidine kinase YesM
MKLFKKSWSFRNMLIIGLSSIIVLTFSLNGIMYYRSYQKIYEKELSQQYSKANQQALARIDLRIKELYRISNYVVFNQLIQALLLDLMRQEPDAYKDYEGKKQMDELLNQTKIDEPMIYSLYLFDPGGNNYYFGHMGDPVNQIGTNDFNVIKEALVDTNGELTWIQMSLPSKAETSGYRDVIVASRWMYSKSVGRYGIMTMILNDRFFSEILDEFQQIDNSDVYLLSPAANLLYTNQSDQQTLPPFSSFDNTDTFVEDIAHKTPYLYTHSKSDNQFVLISRVSLLDLFSQLRHIYRTSLLLAVISIILSGLLILMLTHRLLAPFPSIIRAMKRVQAGDFSNRITIGSNLSEFQTISLSYNAMADYVESLIKEVYERQLYEREAELKAIQAQLNPHFLHNTLNGMYWMLYTEGNKRAAKLILALSELLKYSLERVDKPTTLGLELEQIQHYIMLQLAFIEDNLEYIIHADDEVTANTIQRMILQPLIENSIIHGFRDFSGPKILVIRAFVQEQYMRIEITDNGHGMDTSQMQLLSSRAFERGNSVGLRSVIRRIQLVHGDPFGVTMESNPGKGTKITLRLPLTQESEVKGVAE